MSLTAEKDLLAKLKQGDMQAFGQLFKTHYPGMFAAARRYVYDEDVCRDLIQDVFTYIWEKREQLEIQTSLGAYLYASVKHAALNHLKQKRIGTDYRQKVLGQLNPDLSGSQFSEDGYEAIHFNETQARLKEIIDGLPEQCRNIFVMSRFHGIRHKAIANLLSLSPKTVETQVYRALQVIKEKIIDKS